MSPCEATEAAKLRDGRWRASSVEEQQLPTMATEMALPTIGMMLAECAQVGLMLVSKAVMSRGMSSFVFIFYSNAIAALILLPSSFLFRRTQHPPMSFRVLCGFFGLGLLGCLAQIFGYAGIYYSSATLGTAMLNLIPGFTFILAVALSMEKLNLRNSSSLAKTVGTIVSLGGAFVVTLYKGPALVTTPSALNISYQFHAQLSTWVIGGLFLASDCIFAASFLILQALILKKFPAELTVVFFYCFFVAIQSAIICLAVERDFRAWSLSEMRWLAVLYSGVFGSAFQVGISTWCLRRTGPVFVSMFKPLGIVISVAVGVIFLGDDFFLGSLIGSIFIVTGFYSVMWGKASEQKIEAYKDVESSSQTEPLLPSSNSEGM